MNGYTAASALNHKGGWTRNNSPIQIDKKKKSLSAERTVMLTTRSLALLWHQSSAAFRLIYKCWIFEPTN